MLYMARKYGEKGERIWVDISTILSIVLPDYGLVVIASAHNLFAGWPENECL
jgi:hypothetical protein